MIKLLYFTQKMLKGKEIMSDNFKEIEVPADVEKLDEVQAFIGELLEEQGCPFKTQMAIDVCVEEIFVNIAHYAYAPGTGAATVRAEISGEPPEITITFTDRGKPFDPLAKEDPDVTLSAEERDIGGLGIYMTKKMMDDVSYEYKDGCNILQIRKKLQGD